MHIRGNGGAEVPQWDVIGGQVRRRARASAQERKRLSILQQILEAGYAAQGTINARDSPHFFTFLKSDNHRCGGWMRHLARENCKSHPSDDERTLALRLVERSNLFVFR